MKHSSAVSGSGPDGGPVFIQVFFTRNGKEIPSDGHNMLIALPPHGFFSAISMNQSGEEICVTKSDTAGGVSSPRVPSRAETGSGYAGREGAAAAYSLTWKLPEKPAERPSPFPTPTS